MLNITTVEGRLVRDPELRTGKSGREYAVFSIACERPPVSGKKVTDFFDCFACDKTGKFICDYFSHGDPITVTGRMENNKREDKSDHWSLFVQQATFTVGKASGGQESMKGSGCDVDGE